MTGNALVISGGGSRGAFAVGAIDYMMRERGLEFDVVAGTSTGALIAPLIAADGAAAVPTLRRLYTRVTTSDILEPRDPLEIIFRSTSVYSTKPLEHRIGANLTSALFERLLASPTRLVVTTTNLQTGQIVYFHTGSAFETGGNSETMRITSRDQLMRAVLASAEIPVFMPPVSIPPDADPPRQYVDGGVREYLPLGVAIDAGATSIYAVMLSAEPGEADYEEKKYVNIFDIMRRAIDLQSAEVGENDLRLAQLYTDALHYVDEVRRLLVVDPDVGRDAVERAFIAAAPFSPFHGRRAVTLKVIRPAAPLEGSSLEFVPAVMRRNMDAGYARARQLLGASTA